MKIMCVFLPHFPLRCELQRRSMATRSTRVVIISALHSRRLVMDYAPELVNLQCGMSLQEAVARYGDVELIQADTAFYRSVFNDILSTLETKVPLVEGDGEGVAYLGIDGMEAIYPAGEVLIDTVRGVIPDIFTPQIGVACGKFPAYLAAITSPPGGYRILSGDITGFLKDLSCDVLPVTLKTRKRLVDFGLYTLGQIAPLPPGALQAQFGPEGKRIWELSRGIDNTPLYPRMTEEIIEESMNLTSVTTSVEVILMAAEILLGRIFADTRLAGRGIRSLILWTKCSSSEYWERNIHFKEPSMSMAVIIPRLRSFLEWYSQPGPVEQIGIRVTGLGYSRGRQKSLFPAVRARGHLLEDIRQMELRLGGVARVFRIKEVEPWSRIPERRYSLKPLDR